MAQRKKYAKTPTVYQMEATECGAASLAMICGYYGKFIPLEQLRIDTGVSRDGCNAKNILIAARKYGFVAKGYRKSLDSLLEMTPPCIIHWNFNHFVVWEGIKNGSPYINDPAMGRCRLTMEELDDCFTGVALTFERAEAFQKSRRSSTMADFVRQRLAGQYSYLAGLVAAGLCLAVPGLVLPVFSQVFIDEILLGGNTGWLPAFMAAMAFTILFQAVLTWYRAIILQRLQAKMALLSAYSFLYHLLRLPMVFFDQRYSGDLVSRVDNNNNVSDFLAGDLAETVLNIFVAAFYLILMLIYSPLLTAIGLTSAAVNLIFMHLSSEALANTAMKLQQEQGKLSGIVYSGLSITDTLKASGAEGQYVARILGSSAKCTEMEQKSGRLQEMLNTVPQAADEITGVLVVMAGGLLVIRGSITAGMLTAFASLLASFISPVNDLMGFAQHIQTLKADMSRVEDIMKYREDDRFSSGKEYANMEQKLSGNIELQGVSFGYSPLEPPLVEDFSFHLSSGQSVAFVGASGSGKSTMAKIISGLYAPWGGKITMDGVPYESIPPEILGSSVSTVSQNITLFSGTVRDNLTMWNKSVLEQDMVRAAKDACIHDVITQLPDAYDYELAEGGSNLSGGQRQRLEIARALATDPSILIMDEATSALDPIIEKQIIDNIKRRGCTCIIVAHRLSAIRDCDEIIVMANGRIVQRGTHDELKAQSGAYAQLIKNI